MLNVKVTKADLNEKFPLNNILLFHDGYENMLLNNWKVFFAICKGVAKAYKVCEQGTFMCDEDYIKKTQFKAEEVNVSINTDLFFYGCENNTYLTKTNYISDLISKKRRRTHNFRIAAIQQPCGNKIVIANEMWTTGLTRIPYRYCKDIVKSIEEFQEKWNKDIVVTVSKEAVNEILKYSYGLMFFTLKDLFDEFCKIYSNIEYSAYKKGLKARSYMIISKLRTEQYNGTWIYKSLQELCTAFHDSQLRPGINFVSTRIGKKRLHEVLTEYGFQLIDKGNGSFWISKFEKGQRNKYDLMIDKKHVGKIIKETNNKIIETDKINETNKEEHPTNKCKEYFADKLILEDKINIIKSKQNEISDAIDSIKAEIAEIRANTTLCEQLRIAYNEILSKIDDLSLKQKFFDGFKRKIEKVFTE